MNIFHVWGCDDPPAAAQAYLNLPEHMRTDHLTMNISGIVGSDPDTALHIADQLPAGNHRYAFLAQAAEGYAHTVPADAAAIAELLPDGWDRRNAAESIARAWIENDRVAALGWVEKTGFLTKKAARNSSTITPPNETRPAPLPPRHPWSPLRFRN